MTGLVIDASVAAKWFFPEPHSDRSMRLLRAGRTLWAPDLIVPEFGNLVWKRCRRRELSPEEGDGIVRDFLKLPLALAASGSLVQTALAMAIETRATVYDCVYLALAVDRAAPLVTGDERFVNALAGTPYRRHVRWIGGP